MSATVVRYLCARADVGIVGVSPSYRELPELLQHWTHFEAAQQVRADTQSESKSGPEARLALSPNLAQAWGLVLGNLCGELRN